MAIPDKHIISNGDVITGTIAKKAADNLWYVRINNPTYYDVLVSAEKLPDLKEGDNINGVVEIIHIAEDGRPGLFLEDIEIID